MRQKHDNRAHAGNNTIGQEVLYWAVFHVFLNPFSQPIYALVYPIHRILAHREGYLEHHIKQEEEDGKSPKLMCDDGI